MTTALVTPGSISELARRLLLARADDGDEVNPRGRAIFWVGAGASVSAGIPSGRALAGWLAVRLARKFGHLTAQCDEHDAASHELAFKALQDAGEIGAGLSLASAYGELFARLDATQQRDFIRRVIVKTNGRQVNWAHLALGELVRERIVHTLLTTNFDDLLLEGLVRCDQLPAIIDGVESLNRLDPRPPVPQLVYLHGSQHTYSPRNSSQAVLATRDLAQAQGGLYGLLQQSSVLCVIGYGGNPGEGVMEMLCRASQALPELPIFWISHGQQDTLSPVALGLLSNHANARLIAGQDADLFFRELLRQTRIGVPAWFRDPVAHVLALAERICVDRRPESSELDDEVEEFRTRLRALQPLWEDVGAATRERRELRQLLLADRYEDAWARLSGRELDDSVLLQMRAEASYELGRRHRGELLRQAARDWSAVLRRLPGQSHEWALAQVRLGDVLATMGEQGNVRAVRDAIRAYEHALSVRTRQSDPVAWAATRNDMGVAMLTLGEWGDHVALEAALSAFQDALGVCTRDAAPIAWATAQCNLANALQILGRSRKDGARLQQAVSAYDEALRVHTRDQRPLDWAMTSCDRSAALVCLSQLGSGGRLLEAIRVLDDIAATISRESAPLVWTTLQNHLGVALLAGGQAGDEDALRRSLDVLRAALKIRIEGEAVQDVVTTARNLGGALLELGRRGLDNALAEAIAILDSAAELLDGAVFPRDPALDVAALAQKTFDELQRVVEQRAFQIPGASASAQLDASPTRVVVVEDDKFQQHLICDMLRQCISELEPVLCADGSSALAELALRRPDLVILDLGLPDMDGQTVLANIKTGYRGLPVLVYSGDSHALEALKEETNEALAVLNKGSGIEAFTRLVPTLFKRRNNDGAAKLDGREQAPAERA